MDYTQYFERKTRNDGTQFYFVQAEAPQELNDLMQSIHFDHFYGCLPNNWIYETTLDAFNTIQCAEDDLDGLFNTDPYTLCLAEWYADNCNAFAEEISSEVLMECELKTTSISDLITQTQYEAKRRIYYAVADFLKEREEVQE